MLSFHNFLFDLLAGCHRCSLLVLPFTFSELGSETFLVSLPKFQSGIVFWRPAVCCPNCRNRSPNCFFSSWTQDPTRRGVRHQNRPAMPVDRETAAAAARAASVRPF